MTPRSLFVGLVACVLAAGRAQAGGPNWGQPDDGRGWVAVTFKDASGADQKFWSQTIYVPGVGSGYPQVVSPLYVFDADTYDQASDTYKIQSHPAPFELVVQSYNSFTKPTDFYARHPGTQEHFAATVQSGQTLLSSIRSEHGLPTRGANHTPAPAVNILIAAPNAAPAAPPAAPSGLLAVVAPSSDARDLGLMNAACPQGTVVVNGADLVKAQSKGAGQTVPVPLNCGNLKDGKAVLAPLSKPVLTAFIQANHVLFRLDNGPTPPEISLVPIAVSALKPLQPGGNPGPQPNPKPRPKPEPGPVAPGHGGHLSAIALTAHEKNWLALDEYIAYRTQHAKLENAKPAPKDKHAQLQKLYQAFREKIKANIPPASTGDYSAETAKTPAGTKAAIDGYIAELDGKVAGYKYAPADVALTSDEQTKAKAAPSASGDKNKTLLDDYNAERAQDAQTVAAGETADKGTPHDDAKIAAMRTDILYFRTATKFRTMLGGGAQPANGTKLWDPLNAGLKDYFSKDGKEWADYSKTDADLRAQYADAVSKKADVSVLNKLADQVNANVQKYLGVLAHDVTKDKRSKDDIAHAISLMTDQQHSYMCDQIVKAEAMTGNIGTAPDIRNTGPATQGLAGSAGVATDVLGAQIAKSKTVGAKDGSATPGQAAPPAAPAADPSKITTNSPVYQACAGSPVNPGNGGTTTGNVTPALVTIPPPPPGQTAGGSDTPPAKSDPNNMAHVRSGIGGALVGLVFGTFFGPVGVLVGAAIGFGLGYVTDKYLVTGST